MALGPDDPPTEVRRRADGSVLEEEWKCADPDCFLDRVGAPANVTYHPSGAVESFGWYRHGLLHREDGPAEWNSDTRGRSTEVFYIDGYLHRVDGPAVIRRSATGEVEWEIFYLFDSERTAEEVAAYRAAVESGAPGEWALAYALGVVRDEQA